MSNFGELGYLRLVGLFVNSVDHRRRQGLNVASDGLISKQHEFFYDSVRDVSFSPDYSAYLSVIVKKKLGFRKIEIDRPSLYGLLDQDKSQFVRSPEHLRDIVSAASVRGIENEPVNFGISQTSAAVDYRRSKLVIDEPARSVEIHYRRHSKPIFVGIKGADSVRQIFGKHRYGALRKID